MVRQPNVYYSGERCLTSVVIRSQDPSALLITDYSVKVSTTKESLAFKAVETDFDTLLEPASAESH
jgi:hypothetical protein